jgi:cell division protein FtsI/penicillin-binding protein 2
VQYNAAVCYAQIKEIPRLEFRFDESGKRIRHYRRREYVQELAQRLAEVLDLDASRIEDLIYSKAALFQAIPYRLQEDVPEDVYYRLKGLERRYPGVIAERVPRRDYPQGRIASDVVGYMGAINREEYESIVGQIRSLEAELKAVDEAPDEAKISEKDRCQLELQLEAVRQQAYSINDSLGKTGAERAFEDTLRGLRGIQRYEIDAQGNRLEELERSADPVPGERVSLSISAELQAFAEELLIDNERIRDGRSRGKDPYSGKVVEQRQPWIKGGAVVALDPRTGEVLCLASYPRFDPNDFIRSGNRERALTQQAAVERWLENDAYIAALWDQREPLKRENRAGEEELWLTWEHFLELTLRPDSPVKHCLNEQGSIANALAYQRLLARVFALAGDLDARAVLDHVFPEPGSAELSPLTRRQRADLEARVLYHADELAVLRHGLQHVAPSIQTNYDRLLLADLYGLSIEPEALSPQLLAQVGKKSLGALHRDRVAFHRLSYLMRNVCEEAFRTCTFNKWRSKNEKEFLKRKRLEERLSGTYQHPYLDYLDAEEARQFEEFWQREHLHLIEAVLSEEQGCETDLAPFIHAFSATDKAAQLEAERLRIAGLYQELGRDRAAEYLQSLRSYKDLSRSLLGSYACGASTQQELLRAFYPSYGFGFLRSLSYGQGMAPGSLFKLVTGYAALMEAYRSKLAEGKTQVLCELPVIHDQLQRSADGKSLSLGRFPDGRPIPQYYQGGRLIRSASRAIGEVDFPTALERSSNPYFSLLAAEYLEDPDDLVRVAQSFSFGARTGLALPGEFAGRLPSDLSYNRSGLYATAIGQHSLVATPLQAVVMLSALGNGGRIWEPQILKYDQAVKDLASHRQSAPPFIPDLQLEPHLRREAWMPAAVKVPLWKGMLRAARRTQTRSVYNLYRVYGKHRDQVDSLVAYDGRILGKSSTAEMLEVLGLDQGYSRQLYNHIWYGALFFDHPLDSAELMGSEEEASLAVVVFLRFGGYGYEAAPIAAQVFEKWSQIREARQ